MNCNYCMTKIKRKCSQKEILKNFLKVYARRQRTDKKKQF